MKYLDRVSHVDWGDAGFLMTSDVHLTDLNSALYRDWLQLIEKGLAVLPQQRKHILILGDFFELHIHGNPYFEKQVAPFMGQVAAWRERGVEVHWFEGNHDLYLQEAHHIVAHQSEINKFYVCHGDMLNPKDKGYVALKALLHSFPISFLAKNLRGTWISAIGKDMSHRSKTQWTRKKMWSWVDYVEYLRESVLPPLKEHGVKLVVFGHCHWKKDELVDGVRVVNLGYFPKDQAIFAVNGAQAFWVGM